MAARGVPFSWGPHDELAIGHRRPRAEIRVANLGGVPRPEILALFAESAAAMSAATNQPGEHRQSERAKLHRSQLRALNMALQRAALQKDSQPAIAALHDWRPAELLHHLFEIMYIAKNRTALVAPLLLDWLHRHFTSRFSVELYPAPDAQTRPDYWKAVKHFVLEGHFTYAHTLLTSHARHQADDAFLRQLAVLVRTRPLLRGVSTLTEFLPSWRAWRADVQAFVGQLRSSDVEHAELSIVAALLLGEERAVVHEADMWVEALVGLVYAGHVDATATKLPALARSVIASSRPLPSEALNDVLRAVFVGEADAALLRLYELRLGQSLWLPAHLGLLLSPSPRDSHPISPLARDNRLTLADVLLLEYADELRRIPGLASLALVYAGAVSSPQEVYPRAFIASALEHQEPTTEMQAHRLLGHCTRYELWQTARVLQTVMGLKRLREAGYAAAMHWLLLARDDRRVGAVAAQWLAAVQQRNSPVDLAKLGAAIESLGDPVLSSAPLQYLCDWARLVGLLRTKQLRSAATVLCDLFLNKRAPRKQWLRLLLQVLPQMLSSGTDSPLTLQQVHLLMQCAEDALLSHRGAQLIKDLGPQPDIAVAQLRHTLTLLRTAALRTNA